MDEGLRGVLLILEIRGACGILAKKRKEIKDLPLLLHVDVEEERQDGRLIYIVARCMMGKTVFLSL